MFDFDVLEQFDAGLETLQGGMTETPEMDVEVPDQVRDAVCPFAHVDA